MRFLVQSVQQNLKAFLFLPRSAGERMSARVQPVRDPRGTGRHVDLFSTPHDFLVVRQRAFRGVPQQEVRTAVPKTA